ncbi:MAG: signal peptidase II [bacterium]
MSKIIFLLPVVCFMIDQISKLIIRNNLFLGESIKVFPFLYITYITNTGTAFGLAKGNNTFFIIVILIVIFFIVAFKKSIFSPSWVSFISYSLILGGAFGNLLDRIMFGKVIDFIDFRFWPVFNFADTFVSIGAILYLAESLFRRDCVSSTNSVRIIEH